MLSCAVAFGWVGIEAQHARKQEKAVRVVLEKGGWVYYDREVDSIPAWLRRLFGDTFLREVKAVDLSATLCTKGTLKQLEALSNLQDLAIQYVSDSLEGLSSFAKLRRLDLNGATLTNRELTHVGRLHHLEELHLNDTVIGDRGLPHLTGLTRLRVLGLNSTKVTDDGVRFLILLKDLELLSLYGAQITERGLRELGKGLPNCRVMHHLDVQVSTE